MPAGIGIGKDEVVLPLRVVEIELRGRSAKLMGRVTGEA
jgi:hypothetical protein